MKSNKNQNNPGRNAKKNSSGSDGFQLNTATYLFIIILVSFFAYLPILTNGFVNWDEATYIQNNFFIRSFNFEKLFSSYELGNYHPLTMLVYTIEYHFWGINERGYHAVNLFIHLLNVLLVFKSINLLSEKKEIALVAALLFGIHPLHVESVAWAAELKDLLYTFFFLASFIFYLNFIKSKKKKFYTYALLLFILSLFSKAMAVSLPIVLLLSDYFKDRKLSRTSIIEKIPFLILSVVFGLIAIAAQKSSDSLQVISNYSTIQRIIFACYSYVTYLIKLVLPVNLSAFYPYPMKSGMTIPASFYIYPVIFIGIISYVFYSLRNSRKLFFGLGFFSITVFLVLQLLPVGDAIMADRYSYIPSIGIFYLAGEGFYLLMQRKQRITAAILLTVIAIFFSTGTYARCKVWKNPITLWDDVISKYPNVAFAYNNRGGTLMNENRNEEAMRDYNKAIELRPDYADALNNRSILFIHSEKDQEAVNDLDKAIQIKPGMFESYNNRGLAYLHLNRLSESLKDFNKAIELNPYYAEAFYNRGILATTDKRNEDAYNDYSKAISLKHDHLEAYINRGVLLQKENKNAEALKDYNKALELKPDNPQVYYNKGLVLLFDKKFEEAIFCFSKTIEFSPQYAAAFYSKGMAEYFSGKTDVSCKDLYEAARLGYQPGKDALNEYCH